MASIGAGPAHWLASEQTTELLLGNAVAFPRAADQAAAIDDGDVAACIAGAPQRPIDAAPNRRRGDRISFSQRGNCWEQRVALGHQLPRQLIEGAALSSAAGMGPKADIAPASHTAEDFATWGDRKQKPRNARGFS
jgi:hypothetical protein